jgi:glutamate--glyoxylate aminotransferase
MARKPLDYEELNENVKRAQYAVRGELYLRASELQKEGKKIIFTNVGNPHALGQKPLTFPRQARITVLIASSSRIHHPPWVGIPFALSGAFSPRVTARAGGGPLPGPVPAR